MIPRHLGRATLWAALFRTLLRVGAALAFGAGLYLMLPALPAPLPPDGVEAATPVAFDGGAPEAAGEAGDPGGAVAPSAPGETAEVAPGEGACVCECPAPAPPAGAPVAQGADVAQGAQGAQGAEGAEGAKGAQPPAGATPRIDVNRASVAALETLPGIGPAKARRIVEARPFSRPEDLLRVKGIGRKTVRRLLPLISVGGDPPDRP